MPTVALTSLLPRRSRWAIVLIIRLPAKTFKESSVGESSYQLQGVGRNPLKKVSRTYRVSPL